jgi:hypothetical protein
MSTGGQLQRFIALCRPNTPNLPRDTCMLTTQPCLLAHACCREAYPFLGCQPALHVALCRSCHCDWHMRAQLVVVLLGASGSCRVCRLASALLQFGKLPCCRWSAALSSGYFGKQHWRKSSQWFTLTRPAGVPQLCNMIFCRRRQCCAVKSSCMSQPAPAAALVASLLHWLMRIKHA